MPRPRYIEHITLDTGDTRRSPRDEVDDVSIAALQDGLGAALAGDRVGIPGMDGYTMTATASGRCLMATVFGPPIRGDKGTCDDVPMLTLGIASHSRCGAALWRIMHQDRTDPMPALKTAGQPCPDEPWLAARLEIGAAIYPEAMKWIGDWERCLAWAWLARLEDR